VLLIKTAWGGKSLHRDFRPPSAAGPTGPFYEQMLAETREALARIEQDFPQLAQRCPAMAGFVWMQGWNDMIDAQATAEYADNLELLAQDVRRDLAVPDLPFVIGELGNGGAAALDGSRGDRRMAQFREQQRLGAERVPRARFVLTHEFARPAQLSPNVGHGHHWFGNAESYFLIGDALGRAMVDLLDSVKPASP